jgi:hypothetical protein
MIEQQRGATAAIACASGRLAVDNWTLDQLLTF